MNAESRVTQSYLSQDCAETEQYSSDWIRKRFSTLRDLALIQKVGTSTMYQITAYGQAALDHETDAGELTPAEFGEVVRESAE